MSGVKGVKSSQLNKYKSNFYKVYSGEKPYQVVAKISEDMAKRTDLPRDIEVKQAFFDHVAKRHPELDKNQLFSFVRTLNIPEEVYHLPKQKRLNFFRTLFNDLENLVATGQDWSNPRQNTITSFIPQKPKELKYAQRIKNTSNKVFPIDSGGAGNSSSNMLSQVPGTGSRLPRSSESNPIVPPKVKGVVASQTGNKTLQMTLATVASDFTYCTVASVQSSGNLSFTDLLA